MKSEVLNLGKHFLTIDSTIPFELYNPITQTTINKASGRWVIDCWKLLTKEYFKNNPQFVLELRYDETLLVGKNKIEWHVTDIDIGSIQSEYELVTVANLETSGLAEEETLQTVAKEETLQTVAKEETLQTVAKEETLQNVAKEVTLQTVAKEETLQNVLISLDLQKSNFVEDTDYKLFKRDTLIYGIKRNNERFLYRADSDVKCMFLNGNLSGTGIFTNAGLSTKVYMNDDFIERDVKVVSYITEKTKQIPSI